MICIEEIYDIAKKESFTHYLVSLKKQNGRQ